MFATLLSNASAQAAHADPVAQVAFWLVIILAAAKLGGDLAVRVGQPAVLGELLVGVLLGNLGLVGISVFEPMGTDPHIDMLAHLGVLILLFEVGLESTVGDMLKTGWSSLAVATLGVCTPFALGWGVSAWLLPAQGPYVHAFIGATLTATSVGITARVLKDLGRASSLEARVILGAAVIDDVLGLVVLSVVTGAITAADAGDAIDPMSVALTLGKAAAFLTVSLALGVTLSRRVFAMASRLRARGVLLATGLAFCFLFSWIASLIELAPIVGAFAAGLILEDSHYREFVEKGEHGLAALIQPIASFLTPVFFVLIGLRTNLGALAQPGVLTFATLLTIAAVLGKQVCGLGVGRGIDRLTIGIGMVPRGEVGLIFANVGMTSSVAGQPVITAPIFSAIVVMVIATTIATPPALAWAMSRRRFARAPNARD